MHNATSIANFFINKGINDGPDNDNSPMKLQKLVYFAQGWYLALYQRPLIDEQIEAWEYGPVIPSLFHTMKRFGNSVVEHYIHKQGIPVAPSSAIHDFLEEIWRIYGMFTATQLSNMTHEPGTPWKEVYEKYQGRIPRNTDISQELMKEWFNNERSKQLAATSKTAP